MRDQVNHKTLTPRILEIMFLMMVALKVQMNQGVLIQIRLLEGALTNMMASKHVSMKKFSTILQLRCLLTKEGSRILSKLFQMF